MPPAETLHIVMLYEECLGQTAKTMLAETFAKRIKTWY